MTSIFDFDADNPGSDPNFDAGDLSTQYAAEEAARADYEDQVGSDEHEQAVADAREDAGIDDPSPYER